ncbi:MAG: class I SAM-dependent methyltransferase [Gammaproteobacteria bacterium]|nr:class I SAM-dependent methyltransferase [Gammaproteobacteria bacterium]
MKLYSAACDENKEPILAVLRVVFVECRAVLEIGSGTGQHAVYFAQHMPHLVWQPSDTESSLASINAWRIEARLANVLTPLQLDVNQPPWPAVGADAVFSANTAHILSWPEVQRMFAGAGKILERGGVFALYGPFNYGGRYTSESNARFDAWLKARDPLSGVRDAEMLHDLAEAHGMTLVKDYEMPVNNRTLVWRRPAADPAPR